MAEPARKLDQPSQEAPQEAPAGAPQEAPKGPLDLNEALTGKPSMEPQVPESLREKEERMKWEGMAKLREMGQNMNTEAQQATQQFGEQTKSWWDRVKGVFKKQEAPVKGDAEILKELEKADAAYAAFKGKYDQIMASGDRQDLSALEGDLSKSYDQLAEQVAAEGVAESKAWKKALKTGEEPPVTVAGAKLNEVVKNLAAVRGRMKQGSASGEAPTAEAALPDNVIDLQAERQKRQTAEAAANAAPYRKLAEDIQREIDTLSDEREGWTAETLAAIADAKARRDAALARAQEIEQGGKPDEEPVAEEAGSAQPPETPAAPVKTELPPTAEAPAAEEEEGLFAGTDFEALAKAAQEAKDAKAAEPEGPPEPKPRDRYPNLPEPVPGTFPPGVPDAREPVPDKSKEKPAEAPKEAGAVAPEKAPAEKPAKPKKEKAPAKKLKNGYDAQPLAALKEHMAWRKERLNKPGRFNDKTEAGKKELEAEKAMIAQMEESVARRDAEEPEARPPAAAAEQAPAEPSAPVEAPPAAAEEAPEEKKGLEFLEKFGPEFSKIAEAFLKDPNVDPASAMTGRKAKRISPVDLANLFVKAGIFDQDTASSLALGFVKDKELLKAAQEKFASEVEALRKAKPSKKKP